MPRYVYKCEKCKTSWEELLALHADAPPCPCCESTRVEKQMPTRFTIRTDGTYSKNRKTILDQCGGSEEEAKRMVAALRRQGYDPSRHDFYEPGLADFAYDAKAMIPHDSPRHTMAQRCAERGVGIIDGPAGLTIKSQPREVNRGGKRLAPHLVEEVRKQRLAKSPALAMRDQTELRQQIVEDHGFALSEE